jgi:hypothetical protein
MNGFGKQKISPPPHTAAYSSSSAATTSTFESSGLLNYFLPLNPIRDVFCPVIYVTILNSSLYRFAIQFLVFLPIL